MHIFMHTLTQGGEVPPEGIFPFPCWEVKMMYIQILGLAQAFGFAIG